MEPTEEMKRMARGICAEQAISRVDAELFARGSFDHFPQMRAAIAAIMETSDLAAKFAGWAHMVPPDGGSPTAEETQLAASIASGIRSAHHLKDSNHV